VRHPIAYSPDPEETASILREKLVNSLKNILEKSLLSAWKKCVLQCIAHQDELCNVDGTVDLDKVDEVAEMDSSWVYIQFFFFFFFFFFFLHTCSVFE
jgi:hypothetical protein